MSAAEIEAWFQLRDDGEFTLTNSAAPLVHSGIPETARSIVYCTKPHCLKHLPTLASLPGPLAVIGRYGLPLHNTLDGGWGASTAGRYFVGDADPVDLLIFAWLRTHWRIRRIGVSDQFLTHHNARQLDWIKVPLNEREADALSRLPIICPDYRELLGDYCSSLLESGCKIELEGAIEVLQEPLRDK